MLAAVSAAAVMPELTAPAGAADPSGEAADVAATLETLRMAILTGDGKALSALVHKQLIYGHSDGHLVQTKTEFIENLAGKISYKSLLFSDQTVEVVGNNAVVRHTWDSVNMNDNIGRSYIKVLQVWRKEGETWKLLARQSCPIKS
jgi:hypothetical protein